ncbi:MAG: 50S ribosomal protein L25 [Treponemataceae bacterium]|nr:50S ribosomal protein L25 [Treponemataceae bacterium]
MEHVVLTAQKRTGLGSGYAARLRRSGRLPAVMYGAEGKAFPIELNMLEFAKGIKGISESTLINLSVDGVLHEVFIKDLQRDILTGKFLHVDFYEVEKSKALHAKVPVRILGTAEGVRQGGILEVPVHELEVECLPKDLPEHIDVDVSKLGVNQSLHVRDLVPPQGVKFLSNPEMVVATVKFAKVEGTVAPEASAAGSEAAPKA